MIPPAAQALLALLIFNFQLLAFAQTTAFTYQGRLNDGANPANGSYDLRFILYTADPGGNQTGPILTNSPTPVSNGLFTVSLDFGASAFTNANLFLEIAVRTNGVGNFLPLIPRQKLTAAPYAIFAKNVGIGGLTAGTYGNAVTFNNAANGFSGSFTGNGAGMTNVNAATLGGLSSTGYWKTGGNSGATGANFLGTTDNQALELKVNGTRAFRIEPTATTGVVNVIGGAAMNSVVPGIVGATIGGGGALNYQGQTLTNQVTGDFGFIGGGADNVVGEFGVIGGGLLNSTVGQGATVGGGIGNASTGGGATIGGGNGNVSSGGGATVAGGGENTSSGLNATVGGGSYNTSSGDHATVGGGLTNTASGVQATVPGGFNNTASGQYAFAAGRNAKAVNNGTFVWADDGPGGDFASTLANQFLIRAGNGVGIGTNSPSGALHVVSASSAPQIKITQNTVSQYARLRMNVGSNPFWEMDVSPGATPALQFWNSTLRLSVDYNGNVSATSFTPSSDRNLKENFQPVNVLDVLAKVAALPITKWNFKEDSGTTHLGPMAQDFYGTFGVGPDDKHISTVDADGVALAAIQGLNLKVESENAALRNELNRRETENTELKRRLDLLEQIVLRQNAIAPGYP